jgi:hypothetical protein
MAFKDLSEVEQEIVFQCMKFIAEGSDIGDWEFQTRLGITRPTLVKLISSWPEIDDCSENSDGDLAVNNCLNEVCHGLAVSPVEWKIWFSHPKERIQQTYNNWLKLRGRSSGGIR